MRNIKQHKNNSKGFTLLESMIVLTIMGLVMAGVTLAFESYRAEQTETKLDKTYDSVRSAMNAFILEDTGAALRARYPCPAPLTVGPENMSFGIEQRNADGTCITGAGVFDAGNAYIGALPTNTLELASEFMLDVYGNKMTYAVSKTHTLDNALNANPNGQVQIVDEAGNTVMAPFALVSHGPDGVGAYTIEGGQTVACRASDTSDGENCDFNDAIFRQSRTKLGSEANFYDDRLAFSLVDEDDDEWWSPFEGSPDHLVNKNPGAVCIGSGCDPSGAAADDALITDGNAVIGGDLTVNGAFNVDSDDDGDTDFSVAPSGAVNAALSLTVGTVASPAAAGSISVENDLFAGRDMLLNGELTAGGAVTANGNIASQTGSLLAETGSVVAGTTVTAGGNITSGGSVSAATTVTAGSSVTSGGSVTATGSVSAGTSVSAGGTVSAGGSVTSGGSVSAATTVTAGTDMTAGGKMTAGGDIKSETGNIESALDMTAGNNMDAMHNATAAAFFYNGNGVVGSGGGVGGGGGGDSSAIVNVSCPEGKVLRAIENGSAVCVVEGFGGIYTSNRDGSCRYGNPFLSGKSCSCPSGYSPKAMSEFMSGPSHGHYCDGHRSVCGVTTYQCIANNASVGGGGSVPTDGGGGGTTPSITEFECEEGKYITGFDAEGEPICTTLHENISASINSVASNCIDGANPTLATNLPTYSADAHIRFVITCANRWCKKEGFSSGKMVEKSASTAYMTCNK